MKKSILLGLAFGLSVVGPASAASPRMHLNWWWYYDVENAPGANKYPAGDTGQPNREGNVPFYWSPGTGAASVLDDPDEPGNKVFSFKKVTAVSDGQPIASNNNPPATPPYNSSLAPRTNIANGITLAFRLKGISTSARSGSEVDIIEFYGRLIGGPDLPDRHRFKIYGDDNGNLFLNNSHVGMSGANAPLISDGWHDVWYTSWAGEDGFYHKRVWFDGKLVYNDALPYSGENRLNRRFGFIKSDQTGEWWLDYLGIYDEGAVFLPPVLKQTFDGSTLTLTWDYGVLQQSDVLPGAPGDWTDVEGATSPHWISIPGPGAMKFFRVRSTR